MVVCDCYIDYEREEGEHDAGGGERGDRWRTERHGGGRQGKMEEQGRDGEEMGEGRRAMPKRICRLDRKYAWAAPCPPMQQPSQWAALTSDCFPADAGRAALKR